MLNETINILNDLNLYGLKNSINTEIDYITNNNLPFLEGLNHFLKNELKYREINCAESNIKVAHFPYIKEIKECNNRFSNIKIYRRKEECIIYEESRG